MPRSIEKTTEDVYSLTRSQMLLHNSSKPQVWESEEEFKEFILKMKKKRNAEFKLAKYEMPRGLIDETDLVIHLNPADIEWHGPIIGNLESYCFFLEGTRMGIPLRQAGRKNLLSDERYDSLDGIGRFVEGKTIDWLSEMGYRKELETVRTELSKELNPSTHSLEAVGVCEAKWKEANDTQSDLEKLLCGPGKKKPDYREIIVAMIRAAASYLAEDFNHGFSQIKNMAALDIFVMSGLYTKIYEKLISSQETEAVIALIDKLKIYMSKEDEHQIREIKPVLKQTEELLLQIGKNYNITSLVSISEGISEKYRQIESQPPKLRIEEIKDLDPIKYAMILQTLLDDATMWVNRYSRK